MPRKAAEPKVEDELAETPSLEEDLDEPAERNSLLRRNLEKVGYVYN